MSELKMQPPPETTSSNNTKQWPPKPGHDDGLLQMGVSQIEWHGSILKCRWKTVHPFAWLTGGFSIVFFKLFATAWGFFHRLVLLPSAIVHQHIGGIIKVCAILGLAFAALAAPWIWIFRARTYERLSIDIESHTFQQPQWFELGRPGTMPLTSISGIRLRAVKKWTYVEVGLLRPGAKKIEWAAVAIGSFEDAQTMLQQISKFASIPVVV